MLDKDGANERVDEQSMASGEIGFLADRGVRVVPYNVGQTVVEIVQSAEIEEIECWQVLFRVWSTAHSFSNDPQQRRKSSNVL